MASPASAKVLLRSECLRFVEDFFFIASLDLFYHEQA